MSENSLMGEMSRRRALSAFGGMTAAGGLAAGVSGLGAAVFGTVAANAAGRSGTAARSGTAGLARRPGTLLWRQQAGNGPTVSSSKDPDAWVNVVAADGMVYVSSLAQANGDCDTYAIEAATGRLAWRTQGLLPFDAGAGAVFGFEITGSGTAEVVALSTGTGRTAWTYQTSQWLNDYTPRGWLAYAGDMVYIASGTTKFTPGIQPTLRALDARTGRRVWAASLTGSGGQDPAVADDILYTATNGRVVALKGATGARRWESDYISDFAISALFTADGIVCGNSMANDNAGLAFFALDDATGRQLWQLSANADIAAVASDIVFFAVTAVNLDGTTSSALAARYARSGKLAWTRAATGNVEMAAGNALYLSDGDNGATLVAMAATTGDTLWTYQLAAAVEDVAAADGVVYAADAKGTLYALQA